MPAPIKPHVTLDILEAIAVRVGSIESVEEIVGADKLVRLVVSLGDQRRAGARGRSRGNRLQLRIGTAVRED